MIINLQEKAKNIRLLLLDIDGILTDGMLYYGMAGFHGRTFHIQDGLGIKLLLQSGVQVGIISGKNEPYLQLRCQELHIPHLYLGYEKKLPVYQNLLKTLNLTPQQVAYIGDDILDLPILLRVGLSASVADANPQVTTRVHYITKRPGGKGAVREVCDLIMQAQGTLAASLTPYLHVN